MFSLFLVGGKESVRRYWAKFFQDTDILVFVVDASNSSNLSLVVNEIKSLLGDARLASVPILVLANKQVIIIVINISNINIYIFKIVISKLLFYFEGICLKENIVQRMLNIMYRKFRKLYLRKIFIRFMLPRDNKNKYFFIST